MSLRDEDYYGQVTHPVPHDPGGKMSKPDTPAFPGRTLEPIGTNGNRVEILVPGMSLRDYFAAAALTYCIGIQADREGYAQPQDFDRIAKLCYQIADAMLAESKP